MQGLFRPWVRQGGERELVLGVDDQLLAASPRSIPRADVAVLCVQALLLPEARNRRASNEQASEPLHPWLLLVCIPGLLLRKVILQLFLPCRMR